MIVFCSASNPRVATPSNPLECVTATRTGRADSSVRARFFGGLITTSGHNDFEVVDTHSCCHTACLARIGCRNLTESRRPSLAQSSPDHHDAASHYYARQACACNRTWNRSDSCGRRKGQKRGGESPLFMKGLPIELDVPEKPVSVT